MSNKYTKQRADSPFLTFVAKEFQKRGTELRIKLSDKVHAAEVAKKVGVPVSEREHVLDDIQNLTSEMLGERCVLKFARGWSAQGVMLLKKDGEDKYFEYLSLTTFSLAEIKQKQAAIRERFSSKEPAWIIESFKQGTLPSAAVPFDYKFYVFQGQVGLIFQIDRNANPPRVAMFDGSFKPLTLGEDYKLREGSVQPATPIIPARAMEFVWWAQLLSRETDSPFVSVDLFDTTEGPVFGEYTFSPGAVQKHMFTLSDKFIEELDGYFLDAEKRIGSPGLPDLRNAREETAAVKLNIWALTAGLNKLKELQLIDKETFSRLANVAYMGGSKGAWRLAEHYQINAKLEKSVVKRELLMQLGKNWERCRELLKGSDA